MYNASDIGLNSQININAKVDRKYKVQSNFVTSYFAFKGSIPTCVIVCIYQNALMHTSEPRTHATLENHVIRNMSLSKDLLR